MSNCEISILFEIPNLTFECELIEEGYSVLITLYWIKNFFNYQSLEYLDDS